MSKKKIFLHLFFELNSIASLTHCKTHIIQARQKQDKTPRNHLYFHNDHQLMFGQNRSSIHCSRSRFSVLVMTNLPLSPLMFYCYVSSPRIEPLKITSALYSLRANWPRRFCFVQRQPSLWSCWAWFRCRRCGTTFPPCSELICKLQSA